MSLPFYNAHRDGNWYVGVLYCFLLLTFRLDIAVLFPKQQADCLTLISAFTPLKARGSRVRRSRGKLKIEHGCIKLSMKSSILELNWNKQSTPWFFSIWMPEKTPLWSIIMPKLFLNSIWKLICVWRVWKKEDGWKEIIWTFSQIGSFTC